jgi:YesN/AraC family two-component response regulator
MKRIFSRHALNVFELELSEWPYGTHTHNFCELILVKKGAGYHAINDAKFPFQPGDIFLLTAEDYHYFELAEPTVFLYIKFTEQLFQEKAEMVRPGGKNLISRTLFHPNTIQGTIIKDMRDSHNVFLLAEILLEEFKNPAQHARELSLELFGAITTIVVRQITQHQFKIPPLANDKARIAQVLAHIRQHIGNEDQLSLAAIAQEFNLSVNYVSEYLRKHTGKGLKKIVTETRMERALVLLKQSPLSITEIAQKVGYSDLSHMNKIFKKYRNTSPSKERN